MRNADLVPQPPRLRAVERAHHPDEYLSWSMMIGMIRRRWLLVLAALGLTVGAAVAYLLLTPPVYEAGTSLLVDQEQYNLPEVVKRLDPHDDDLGTQVELLRSTGLTAGVVRDLGFRAQLASPSRVPRSELLDSVQVADSAPNGELTLTRVSSTRFVASREGESRIDSVTVGQPAEVAGVRFILKPAAAERETIRLEVSSSGLATQNLQDEIKVSRPDRSGNLIWIRYQSIDPVLVAQVPERLAQHYLAHRIEAARAKVRTAVGFLRQEADTLRQKLFEAENDLQSYREQQGIVSLPDEATTVVTEIGELRLTRAKLEAERASLARLVEAADTTKMAAQSPYRELMAFPTLIKNPIVSDMLGTLAELENQRSELLMRRTTKDPDVQANTARIASVDAQLRNLTMTYLNGLESQVASLDRALQAHSAISSRIPRKSVEDDRLSRRPKLLGEVYALVETKLQEARIAEGAADPGARIVDSADRPEEPVWPRKGLILAVALMVGLVAGGGIAWAREGMDASIHSRADVIRAADTRIIGFVPRTGVLHRPEVAGRVRFLPRKSKGPDRNELAAREAYTWLESNLALNHSEQPLRSIAFTSPLSREGKTINAVNLAMSLGRRGRRVVLIDGDLRRGRIHEIFGLSKSPGLAEVLNGWSSLEKALRIVPTEGGAPISVLTAGEGTEHPAELLRSEEMRSMLARLEAEFDMVVCDSPPVNLVSDSLFLARMVDGVVLVARAGMTEMAALTDASGHLREVDAPLLGVLLNDIDLHRDGSYDDAYRYLHQAGAYASAGRD